MKPKIVFVKGIKEIENMVLGGFTRQSILQALSEKYEIKVGTVDKWIQQARKNVNSLQKEAEVIRLEQMREDSLQMLKEGMKSDLELEFILCKIASGEIAVEEWIRGVPVIRKVTPTEMISAIRTLFLKRGSYAPTKFAQTDSDGNDVKQVIMIGDKEIIF